MRVTGRRATILAGGLTAVAGFDAAAAQTCEGPWRRAALTSYSSYPEPGSEECLAYNGCAWEGMFFGLDGKQSRDWVESHDIAAVHEKDWPDLGMKVLELRQGDRRIEVQVYDLCSDTDCEGCCTRNLGGDGFLIDLESATAARFGAADGVVEFRVCP